jgi:hypothetical protein
MERDLKWIMALILIAIVATFYSVTCAKSMDKHVGYPVFHSDQGTR